MIFLSSNSTFGTLTDRETFVFYDRPVLFTATNAAGHLYLVNWLEDDDDGTDKWLVVAVSAARLDSAKFGRITLAELFTQPQTESLWRIVTGRSGELLQSTTVSPATLTADDLPIPGIKLLPEGIASTPEATAQVEQVTVSELAKAIALPVFYLKLYPHSPTHDAPARELGGMLSSLQEVVSAQYPRKRRSRRSNTKPSISPFMIGVPELRVLGSFPSSFGLKLALVHDGTDSAPNQAFSNVVDLIASTSSVSKLEAELSERSKETVSALSKFFKSARDVNAPIEIEAATPQQTEGVRVELTASNIREAYQALKSQVETESTERTLTVEMVGINVRARTFEVRDIRSGNTIKGKIGKEIFNEVEKASIPDRYRVVLVERTSRATSGQMKTEWVLVNATKLA